MPCDHKNNSVIDSRTSEDGYQRRRRRCESCGFRWTTYEVKSDELKAMRLDVEKLNRASSAVGELLKR